MAKAGTRLVEVGQEVQQKLMLDQDDALLGPPATLYSTSTGPPTSAVSGLTPLAGP